MKVFVILLVLIGFLGAAFAESNTGDNVLAISTPFNSYVSGDKVYVYIDTNPHSNVTINVIDPSLSTVDEIFATSDEDGRIFTTFFLPVYSELGTWVLDATNGTNFDTVEFDVVEIQKERMIHDIMELEKYRVIRSPFAHSDHVLVGTIHQIENMTNGALRYSIDVDFYLKNKQSFDFITAALDNIEKPTNDNSVVSEVLSLNSPSFVKGDLGFIYLKNIDGQYKILPQSFVIEPRGFNLNPGIVPTSPFETVYDRGDQVLFSGLVQKAELYKAAQRDKPFELNLTVYDENKTSVLFVILNVDANGTYEYKFQTSNYPAGEYEYEIAFMGGISGSLRDGEITIKSNRAYLTPLKQSNSGISFDKIQCKENLVLIQKYDGSPACVTEQTKTKLIERGWAGKDDSISKTSKDCMTVKQSKQIAPFFKTPTYLPEGYSHVCSQSGALFESYAVYHNKEVFVGWIGKKHLLIDEGAIFIYQIDERNMIGDKKFQTYGSPEQRTRETYDSVIEGNPSLNPQLITINGMLAYAVDSCPDCGMQTANFTDGSSIQESTSTKTRIKFIDDNGVNYMLETTLPLSELIKVAESLQ